MARARRPHGSAHRGSPPRSSVTRCAPPPPPPPPRGGVPGPPIGERDAQVLEPGSFVAAGGDEPDDLVAAVHDRDRRRVGVPGIHQQRHEALPRAGARRLAQRLAADEFHRLVQMHEAIERGHEGGVLGSQVGLPTAIALLEAQAVHGIEPEVDERELAPRRHQQLMHRGEVLVRHVQLPAELAHVVDPHRERFGVRDRNRAHREPRESGIRQVRRGDPGDQLTRARTDHDQRAVAGSEVRDTDQAIARWKDGSAQPGPRRGAPRQRRRSARKRPSARCDTVISVTMPPRGEQQ